MTTHYIDLPFTRNDLAADPIQQFGLWFQQAKDNHELEPTAMTLATVNRQYDVDARMLLLKGFDHRGFIFYTNYDSAKGKEISEIDKAAMVFWWPICQRQVRITGAISFLSAEESDTYFNSRSREKRIAAIASKQSALIENREQLTELVEETEKQYEQFQIIPRPTFWGGYILTPATIEFWQGREHRLHDRFEYRKVGHQWEIVQLAP